jgi:hypothetical protein
VKNACAREIEIKAALEKILRACLDDVKNEIQRKKQMSFAKHQNIYYGGSQGGQGLREGEKNLSQ